MRQHRDRTIHFCRRATVKPQCPLQFVVANYLYTVVRQQLSGNAVAVCQPSAESSVVYFAVTAGWTFTFQYRKSDIVALCQDPTRLRRLFYTVV